jgi:hypothetical protein
MLMLTIHVPADATFTARGVHFDGPIHFSGTGTIIVEDCHVDAATQADLR